MYKNRGDKCDGKNKIIKERNRWPRDTVGLAFLNKRGKHKASLGRAANRRPLHVPPAPHAPKGALDVPCCLPWKGLLPWVSVWTEKPLSPSLCLLLPPSPPLGPEEAPGDLAGGAVWGAALHGLRRTF